MNYCLGCHSLEHQRHVRTAEDLGIPTDLYQASLLPAGADMGSHITNAMPAAGAKNWFGAQPRTCPWSLGCGARIGFTAI